MTTVYTIELQIIICFLIKFCKLIHETYNARLGYAFMRDSGKHEAGSHVTLTSSLPSQRTFILSTVKCLKFKV